VTSSSPRERIKSIADTEAAGSVTLIPILVCGMIVLGMVGISLYGARTLPWDARILNGRGPWYVTVSLVVFPVLGAILYGIFLSSASAASHRSRQPVEIVILFFALLALSQFWTIKTARSSRSTG